MTHFTEGALLDHEWSPDGRFLLLSMAVGLTQGLWLTDAQGGHVHSLKAFEGRRVFGIRWLPNSRQALILSGQRTSDVVLINDYR